jgi:Uma2 family endonuclease
MGRRSNVQTQIYLTPKDQGRPLTLEEFQHAASRNGYHYELIDGRLQVSPLPDYPHAALVCLIRGLLARYAEQNPEVLRRVRGPARVFVHGRRAVTAPEPDVAAYRDFPSGQPRSRIRWQDISPMLVVEVLSEKNADKDLVRNLQLYLEVPTIREYWIVDPRQDADRPNLTVHRRRGSRWPRPLNVPPRRSYTTRLLPGFILTLAETSSENTDESHGSD